MASSPTPTTVFVGSASQMEQMLNPAISAPMIATGNIGIYGHLSGVFDMVINNDMRALTAEWAGTAPGVLEQGEDTVVAKQSVTIRNNGATALTIPVGTLVSTSSGSTFQVLEERQPGQDWVAGPGGGDGTYGGYVIQSGASITVTVEATQDGPAGNALPNAINSIAGIAWAQVTASTPTFAAWTMGTGAVTLSNSGTSTAKIWVGTTLTGTSGSFAVGNEPGGAGYVAALSDSSSGYYLIAPGASLSVPVYSTNPISASTPEATIQLEDREDAPAGSITGGALPAGVSVTGSTAIVQGGVMSPSENGSFGPFGPGAGRATQSEQAPLTTSQGFVASEADVNVDYGQMMTNLDLQNWEAYVDAERAVGVMNVAPIWGDNQIAPIATADEAATLREAALYGGGLSFDMPPAYVLAVAKVMPGYIPAMVSEIKWANSEGLRTSMIISPLSGVDGSLLENTETLVALLKANGAMPSQFIVENYAQVPAASGTYFSTTSNESLNAVSIYLASLSLKTSTSESGLEVAGQASADDVITGMEIAQSAVGSAPLSLFAGTQVFSQIASDAMTVTVSLALPGLGVLSTTGAGTVSEGGTLFTASGDATQIQADLQDLAFTASLGAIGSEAANVSIVDAVGTISGTSSISVDDALSLGGLVSTVTLSGFAAPFASIVVSEGMGTAPLTASVTLSDAAAGRWWNFAPGTLSNNGVTVTFTGTAAQVQADLQSLSYGVPSTGGQNTASLTISDGTDQVSASEAIAVTQSAMTVAGLPGSYVSAPFGVDAPFQDVLFAAPGVAVNTARVALAAGAATLVSTQGGVLSADGLSWAASGTVAQIQADLRGLDISVAPSANKSSEAMTLTLDGQSTAIMLSVESTHVVYVGSSGAMDGLANTTVAAPLLATGTIGLFGQQSGVIASAYDASLPTVVSVWSSTGAGIAQVAGASLIIAQGKATLKNTTSAAIAVPVGTLLSTASGVTFSVPIDTGGGYAWQPGPVGSQGYYLVAAGASLTVPVEATQDGPSGNFASNSLTQIQGIAGLTISASALTGAAWAMGSGTVTLTNTGSVGQTIWEGDTVTGSGGTYRIGNDPTVPGFISGAADNSTGGYALEPGQSISVPVFSTTSVNGGGNAAVQAIAAENAGPNSISGTGNLPTGIVVSSSSAITTVGATSSSMQDSFGARGANTGTLTDSSFGQIYSAWGVSESEIDVLPSWATIASAIDLANWKGYVDNARALGAMNVALVTPMPYTTNFATSEMTQWMRMAALYGGGIGLEQSPLTVLRYGTVFVAQMANMFNWAAANGLRGTLILDQTGDPTFREDSMTLLAALKADGGLPSQVIVSGLINANAPAEQANGVALSVASLALTPSASESGLDTTGTSAAKTIMTGVAPSFNVAGSASAQPFAETQVFAQSSSDSMTATVALVSTALGSLVASGAGTVSADGSTFVVSGTSAAVTAALQNLSYAPLVGSYGIATLNLSVVDCNGTIQGTTKLMVDDALSLSGLISTQTVAGSCMPLASLLMSQGMESGAVSATVSYSGPAVGIFSDAFGGTIVAGGGSFTVQGSLATVQSVLQVLSFSPAAGAVGNDIVSVSLSDGTMSSSAASTLRVQQSASPVVVVGPGVAASLQAGQTLWDEGYGNTVVLPGNGPVTISGNTVNNGDVFDLRAAMGTTNWNGSLATLGNYLTTSVASNKLDLDVWLHPTGGASSSLLVALTNDATARGAFQRFEQHALLTIPASQWAGTGPSPVFISGPGITTAPTPGETLYDTAYGNTITLPASGPVTISGNTVNNGDVFDLRAVMDTTNWNGSIATLGNYLTTSVASDGVDLDVWLHPTGGASSSLLVVLLNDATARGAFQRFEQHALLTIPASEWMSNGPRPVFISGPGMTMALTPGELLYDTAYGNTLILPAGGAVTVTGNTVNNGDIFDLRAVMATTNWNGQAGSLSNYLTSAVVNGGQDLNIMLSAGGAGSASRVLMTLQNDGNAVGAFARFEQHGVFH